MNDQNLRIRFYESIMQKQRGHGCGQECRIAASRGAICCNPLCNGIWGTGCWCCHSLKYATEADEETMRAHLGWLDGDS